MFSLKQCPFCGSKNSEYPPKLIKPFNSSYFYVACQSCFAQGPKSVNKEIAIRWWNFGKGMINDESKKERE